MKDPVFEYETSVKLSSVEKNAYDRIKAEEKDPKKKNKRKRIDPDSFRDLEGYGDSVVDADIQTVSKKKEYFAQRDRENPHQIELLKISEVSENILMEQIELNEWFGPDAFVIRTSEYDDYVNFTDAVVEFDSEEGTSHLALGIDITFGVLSETKIQQKFESIRDDLKVGKLQTVKYFESEHGEFKGELSEVPKVVIGIDRDMVNDLAEAWLTQQLNSKSELEKRTDLSDASKSSLIEKSLVAKKKLENHFIQILLLEQIKLQLETYIDYVEFPTDAIALKEDRIAKISERLNNSLDTINNILDKKNKLIEKNDRAGRLLEDLRNRLDSIFGFKRSAYKTAA